MRIPNEKYFSAMKRGGKTFYHKKEIPLSYKEKYAPGINYWHKQITGENYDFHKIGTKPIKLPFTLKEKQIAPYEHMIKMRNGLMELSTGFGKTVLMIAGHLTIKMTTLILVHTKDMVKQTAEEFEKFTKNKVIPGKYNSDYKYIDPKITITTFASFSAHPELFQNFNLLFVDECDAYFSQKARDRIIEHPAIRKIGFTGTIKTASDEYKKKEDTSAMKKFWGYTYTDIEIEQKISKIFHNSYKKDYIDQFKLPLIPSGDWTAFRRALDDDKPRKVAQFQFLKRNAEKEDRILVLLDRVADVEIFHKNWKEGNKFIIHGKIKKKDRDQIKEKFLKEGGVLFAQYKTSSRGVDYPECNKLFLLFPIKNESTVRQSVGRVVRKKENKKAFVYDWIDSSLFFQWKKRKKIYEKFFPEAEIIDQTKKI